MCFVRAVTVDARCAGLNQNIRGKSVACDPVNVQNVMCSLSFCYLIRCSIHMELHLSYGIASLLVKPSCVSGGAGMV